MNTRFSCVVGIALLAGGAGLLPASSAHAQAQQAANGNTAGDGVDAITAERPGFTNGTETVALHHIQFETGYLYARQGGLTEHHLDDGGQLRYPFGDRAEFRVGLPVYFLVPRGSDDSGGFGDAAASVKWRFLEATPQRPSLALIAGTSLPTGAVARRSKNLQPVADLESEFNLSPLWQVQANAMVTRASDGDQRFSQYAGGFNVGYNVTPQTTAFAEVYRIAPTGLGAPNANYLDGGVTYVLGANTQLDVNGGVGISRGIRRDSFLGAGIGRRW
jgi:hypothetical protein